MQRTKFILGGVLILAAVVYSDCIVHTGQCRIFYDD